MRDGRIGLAPLGAVLSFLHREEAPANDQIVARAGRYAADWTFEDLSRASPLVHSPAADADARARGARPRQAAGAGHRAPIEGEDAVQRHGRRRSTSTRRCSISCAIRRRSRCARSTRRRSHRLLAHCAVDAEVDVTNDRPGAWSLVITVRGAAAARSRRRRMTPDGAADVACASPGVCACWRVPGRRVGASAGGRRADHRPSVRQPHAGSHGSRGCAKARRSCSPKCSPPPASRDRSRGAAAGVRSPAAAGARDAQPRLDDQGRRRRSARRSWSAARSRWTAINSSCARAVVRLDTGRLLPEVEASGPLADLFGVFGRLAQQMRGTSGAAVAQPAIGCRRRRRSSSCT